jgi:cytochrome oxidase Cu insertion factor (SCO1/SenC/PrrC family)
MSISRARRWLSTRFFTAIAAILLLPLCLSQPALANEDARGFFGDDRLFDQHGREHRFYSDLLHDRVVLIHPLSSGCEGTCSVVASRLVELQNWLGNRLGTEVHILSISVDPARDAVGAMAEYANRFGAREGWYMLTGDPAQLSQTLGRLGYSANPSEDSSVMLIGNVPTGLWKKAHGGASAEELIGVLDSVINDTGR